MEWSIAEVASSAGISSRTLRHYDAIGLLAPACVAANGYRFYSEPQLLRLQQILAFKELGLSLHDIAAILDSGTDPVARLEQLSRDFATSIERLQRQRESIRRALTIYRSGGVLVPVELFDGFDHAEHQQEVEERWGQQAYASSDRWWTAKSAVEQAAWKAESKALAAAWTDAWVQGVDPGSEAAQQLALRQSRWLSTIAGTPGAGTGEADSEYLLGLGELYVTDERFGANYGGTQGAEFVSATLRMFVERRDGPAGA